MHSWEYSCFPFPAWGHLWTEYRASASRTARGKADLALGEEGREAMELMWCRNFVSFSSNRRQISQLRDHYVRSDKSDWMRDSLGFLYIFFFFFFLFHYKSWWSRTLYLRPIFLLPQCCRIHWYCWYCINETVDHMSWDTNNIETSLPYSWRKRRSAPIWFIILWKLHGSQNSMQTCCCSHLIVWNNQTCKHAMEIILVTLF